MHMHYTMYLYVFLACMCATLVLVRLIACAEQCRAVCTCQCVLNVNSCIRTYTFSALFVRYVWCRFHSSNPVLCSQQRGSGAGPSLARVLFNHGVHDPGSDLYCELETLYTL